MLQHLAAPALSQVPTRSELQFSCFSLRNWDYRWTPKAQQKHIFLNFNKAAGGDIFDYRKQVCKVDFFFLHCLILEDTYLRANRYKRIFNYQYNI